MTNQDIRSFAYPDDDGKRVLNDAGRNLKLSARAYMRCLRVARTLADLDGASVVSGPHIAEALRLRP